MCFYHMFHLKEPILKVPHSSNGSEGPNSDTVVISPQIRQTQIKFICESLRDSTAAVEFSPLRQPFDEQDPLRIYVLK